ncbi:hypothetical protein Vadar_032519 [Vaccinium darrowii]|uniref:Uncharacterized protein n=1 Tax=Vaccinium darrowii TaxID=229202 RepID=A0ACB7YHS9_9ERIC|nr:hypothetical protein Vadar_032519 [Vaccinium darrowii]
MTVSCLLKFVDGLFSSCGDERIIECTTNHRERDDAALPPLVDMDTYIHMASPQSVALPDGGEIVQLDSSEQKPLDDFDATSNRVYQSDVLVPNSEGENMREASRRQCMPKSVLSLVDSTTRISSKNFDAPNSSANLERAYQSGPIVFNSKEKDSGEGLNRECLTKSVLSLDDSSRQKSLLDVDTTKNKTHLVRAYQQGLVLSLLEHKNRGEALKRECITKSILCSEDLQQHSGVSCDDAAKNFGAIYDVGIHMTDSLAQKSLKVVETLSTQEEPNDSMPLLSIGRLPLEGWVQEEKSPNLPRVLQNVVEERVKKLPICLEGLTAESARASHWPISLLDGRHIVVLHPLEQSTKNVAHAARVDQCSPTMSLPENKMVRKTLKRKCRTMSVTEIHQPYFGRRCDGFAKNFRAKRIGGKHVTNRVSTVKRIHKQHGIHQWPFRQSAIGLPNGGHIPSLLENKIVRNTLKRKCRTMSVLGLEDHQQHVDRSWEDDANFLGAKRICRQLAIDCKSPEKCIRRQQGSHQCQFKQSAGGLQDRGCMLSLSKKKIVRKTLKRKCRTMSVINLEYHQHVDNRWEDAVKSHGSNGAHAAKRVCRKLVIHHVSSAKRIHRQPGIYQCPFQQKYWATMKGNHLVDERLVEVTSLCVDGKLILRLQRIHTSWLGRFSRRPSDLPGGGEFVGPITLSSSEFAATNNRAHHVGQDQSGATASHSKNKRTREQEDREEINKTITLNDLRQHYGRKRKDAADSLGVSVSTLKRISRLHGITRWPNIIRQKVLKPPDPHGETNPSATCEKLSTNRQIEMENDPAPSQPMPTIPHITGSSDDWRSLLASQEEPFLEGHVCGSSNWATASCYDPALSKPLPTMPHTMGSLNDWRNLLASQEEPLLEGDVSGNINWAVASCFDPTPIQPLPTSLQTMGTSEDWSIFLPSQEEPFIEGHVSESINWIVPPCSNLDPIQPMSTNPYTMPTIPLMTPTRFMKLKAIYGDTTIKFQLPLTSGINELKKEVSKILEFEHGSFNIEYKDEDGDWILMARDENVREYLQLLNSLGNQVAKLKIRDKVPNTTNFCETCGTLKHNRP